MEGSQDFPREGVKGIEDQWVGCGGRAEFVGEGGVNKIDEEVIWEESDCLIIGVRGWYMIWATGQGIRGTKVFPRDVLEGEVEFGEVKQPLRLSPIQIAGVSEIGQVFVVREDPDSSGGPEEVVSLGVQCSHYSQQFLVIDVVVAFGRSKGLREIGAGVPTAVGILL